MIHALAQVWAAHLGDEALVEGRMWLRRRGALRLALETSSPRCRLVDDRLEDDRVVGWRSGSGRADMLVAGDLGGVDGALVPGTKCTEARSFRPGDARRSVDGVQYNLT
jgi:hypothetical protein